MPTARNALRPFTVAFARPRPRRAIAAPFSTKRRRPRDLAAAPDIDPTSLSATLEAHRHSNRASTTRKLEATADDGDVWYRPELPQDRFDADAFPAEKGTPRIRLYTASVKKGANRQMEGAQVALKKRELPPQDYVGQYVEPLWDAFVPDSEIPWFAASRLAAATAMERLGAEMRAFAAYAQPTATEQLARDTVVHKATHLVRHLAIGYRIEPFGSQVNGLALASSDIDLRLYDERHGEISDAKQAPFWALRKQASKVIPKIYGGFLRSEEYTLVFLRYSRYPLISAQHKESGLDVQIVASNDTSHARGLMANYLQELPALRVVFTAIKQMLQIRGLTDVFKGGLGSYSIFYMVVAAMKLGPQPSADDPAAQLLTVLDFYSKFDTTTDWITVEPAEIKQKDKVKPRSEGENKLPLPHCIGRVDPDKPYLLCLVDPADAGNDLGRKAFGWKHIQTTMSVLKEELEMRLARDDGSLLLTPVVGRNFAIEEATRKKLHLYGLANPIGHKGQQQRKRLVRRLRSGLTQIAESS